MIELKIDVDVILLWVNVQAFFAVIDGHGGYAAADYVAENLGKNIMKELQHFKEDREHQLERAIRQGYSVTDKGFLSQVAETDYK